MEESVLYRLVLAKTFLDQARANAARHHATSLAVAIVNLHDALDNLCGAVASHLGVHVPESATLLKTFDRLADQNTFPGRVKLDQLNALRNSVKHQGLHPNPMVVRQLMSELTAVADEIATRVFGKPVTAVRTVDLITDETTRRDMALVEQVIESGDYRNALEQMAFIVFRVYERSSLRAKRWARLFSSAHGKVSDAPSYDFPEIDKTDRRLDFVELGLDPQEYDAFHTLVPRVGLVEGASDTAYVIKKSRSTWHAENWTRANCDRAFDFLMRLIIAQQNRTSRPQVISHRPYDRVRFVRDSAIYERGSGDMLVTRVRAGEQRLAAGLPFVENTWQNFGEERVLGHFYHEREWGTGYINKIDVEIEENVEPSGDESDL